VTHPRLHVVADWDDSFEGDPTRKGDFPTPGGLPDRQHVVHRLVCPHHSIPWTRVIAVCAVVTVGVSLVMRGLFH
jgi:hypothetical protein